MSYRIASKHQKTIASENQASKKGQSRTLSIYTNRGSASSEKHKCKNAFLPLPRSMHACPLQMHPKNETVKGNSVIKHRLQVLLASRQDLVLLLVLQVRELLYRFGDDLEGGLDLVFGDDEGGREADDVLVGWFGLRGKKRNVSVGSIEGVGNCRLRRLGARTRTTRFSGSRRWICG
jgi:hypothetical protein